MYFSPAWYNTASTFHVLLHSEMSVLTSWLATSAAWMLMWMVEQICHPGRGEECFAALLTGQRLQLLRPKVENKLSFSKPLVGGCHRNSTKIFFNTS